VAGLAAGGQDRSGQCGGKQAEAGFLQEHYLFSFRAENGKRLSG